MSEQNSPPAAPSTSRPEWPPPPRPLTLRGVLLVVGWLVVAAVIAVAGIYTWRGHRQRVRAFWGPDTIAALEWAQRVELRYIDDPSAVPPPPEEGGQQAIDLSDAPSLGHLRQALLDDRHYRWDETPEAAPQQPASRESAEWVLLTFSEVPREHAPAARLVVDLQSGQIGPPGLDSSVRLTERVRKALRHYLTTVADAQRRDSALRRAD